MAPSLKALGIDQLSVDDRLQLVEAIWDDIASTLESREIPQSHKDLLDDRISSHEKNPRAGVSWDDIQARLLPRVSGDSA